MIDLLEHPERAKSDQIVAIPTLVRKLPPPLKRMIGDLSNKERVIVGLELDPLGSQERIMASGLNDSESPEMLRLRLFVSGATPRSMRAIAAVRKLCETAAAEGYTLEVNDIYQNPASARENQIVALPTLLKLAPVPKRMFIGDVADVAPLAAGLGLPG